MTNQNLEIERKFLVKNSDFVFGSHRNVRLIQAYLNSDPERTVRIRRDGDRYFMTVKGAGDARGISRTEWERQITGEDFEILFPMVEAGVISKQRWYVDFGGHTFEVDVFDGRNRGLIVAEVELSDPDELVIMPNWLGKEVTGIERYYNSKLAKHPFEDWPKDQQVP